MDEEDFDFERYVDEYERNYGDDDYSIFDEEDWVPEDEEDY